MDLVLYPVHSVGLGKYVLIWYRVRKQGEKKGVREQIFKKEKKEGEQNLNLES